MVKHEYDNGITVMTSGGYPNGVRYEGSEGWIFVSRGAYVASSSDPVAQEKSKKALDASDPKILESKIALMKPISTKLMISTATGLTVFNLEKTHFSRRYGAHGMCGLSDKSHCNENTSKTSLEFEN